MTVHMLSPEWRERSGGGEGIEVREGGIKVTKIAAAIDCFSTRRQLVGQHNSRRRGRSLEEG